LGSLPPTVLYVPAGIRHFQSSHLLKETISFRDGFFLHIILLATFSEQNPTQVIDDDIGAVCHIFRFSLTNSLTKSAS